MARKGPKNAIGLTPRQYELRFAGWRVPKALLRELWAQSLPFVDCVAIFNDQHPGSSPRVGKVHGIVVAKRMKENAEQKVIFRMLKQRWTPDAQEYLLGFLPEDIRAALRFPPPAPSVASDGQSNPDGGGVYVDDGLTSLERFERKYGKVVDNAAKQSEENDSFFTKF